MHALPTADGRAKHVDQFLNHRPRSTSTKPSSVKLWSCPLIVSPLAQGSYLAIWACTENRLGRVGTIKYFSWLSVALVLTMALSADVIPLFLTVSMATYFIIGERCAWCVWLRCAVRGGVHDLRLENRIRFGFGSPMPTPAINTLL